LGRHRREDEEEKKDAEAPSNEKLRRGLLEVKHDRIFVLTKKYCEQTVEERCS
jgi:hypothetical protein